MLYTFTRQTREEFEKKMGLDLTQFYDELCSRKVQEAIVALVEIEYARGHNDGAAESQEDIDTLMEEQYNRGYDDAIDNRADACDQAYNEGFGQALQEVQDAILHIGRSK